MHYSLFFSIFPLGIAAGKTTINNRERDHSPGMLRGILYPGFAALLLLLLVPIIPCKAAKRNHHLCTSSCGHIWNISYPFRLIDDPWSCGKRYYELSCEKNLTILYDSYSGKYKVKEINYEIFTITVVDDFSSLSLHPLIYRELIGRIPFLSSGNNSDLNFIDCETPMNSSRYMDMAPCSKNSSNQTYSYVVVGNMQLSDLENSCRIDLQVSASTRGQKIDNSSCSGIHDWKLHGTDLGWSPDCPDCGETLVFEIHSVYFYQNIST